MAKPQHRIEAEKAGSHAEARRRKGILSTNFPGTWQEPDDLTADQADGADAEAAGTALGI